MNRSRLPAVLLAIFFALHLTVAGGFARALQQSGDMQDMDMDMKSMSSDVATNVAPGAAEAPSSDEDEEPCPTEAPCSIPGMPGHCPSVASCALTISSAINDVTFDTPASLRAAIASSRFPLTRTSPPELPPPRS